LFAKITKADADLHPTSRIMAWLRECRFKETSVLENLTISQTCGHNPCAFVVRTLKDNSGKNQWNCNERSIQSAFLSVKATGKPQPKKKEVISEEGYKLCSHACIRNGIDMQMT
jgi:hypothetical protein